MEFHLQRKIDKTHFKVHLNTFWPIITTFDYFWTTRPWWISLEDEFDGSDPYDHDGFHSKTNSIVPINTIMLVFTQDGFDGFGPSDHDGFHSKTNLMVLTHMTMIDFTRRRIGWSQTIRVGTIKFVFEWNPWWSYGSKPSIFTSSKIHHGRIGLNNQIRLRMKSIMVI